MDNATFEAIADIAKMQRIHQYAAKVRRQQKDTNKARYHERKASKCAAFIREVATDIELGYYN